MGPAVEPDQHSITTTAEPLLCPSTPSPPTEKFESLDISTGAMTNLTIKRASTDLPPKNELHSDLHVDHIRDMEGNESGIKTEVVDIPDQDNPVMKTRRRMLMAKGGPNSKPYLPGQPRILLEEESKKESGEGLKRYLRKSHLTDETDGVLKWMKYIFVQTPSFLHITTLHHQASHDRDIKIDHHPCLHLVWYYERIFIKPIPAYLYCSAFWQYIQQAHPDLYKACLGFMRSYLYLIQYEIDFEMACEKRLIPKKTDGKHPTYEEWCRFIRPFSMVSDKQVTKRYEYGELRLSRLNLASMVFQRKLAFFHIYPQWGSFLTYSLAPLLTIFAICSVVLNSMQVSLQALDTEFEGPMERWHSFKTASIWFPIGVSCLIALVIVIALAGVCGMAVIDVVSGHRTRNKKRKGQWDAGETTHGVIW